MTAKNKNLFASLYANDSSFSLTTPSAPTSFLTTDTTFDALATLGACDLARTWRTNRFFSVSRPIGS
jgi:hypothetical protein